MQQEPLDYCHVVGCKVNTERIISLHTRTSKNVFSAMVYCCMMITLINAYSLTYLTTMCNRYLGIKSYGERSSFSCLRNYQTSLWNAPNIFTVSWKVGKMKSRLISVTSWLQMICMVMQLQSWKLIRYTWRFKISIGRCLC